MHPAAKHNLAPESTSFVGRELDLAALDALLGEGARVVTVLGAPGTGKTRLARRFAERMRARLESSGGTWFVDLTAAHGIDDVCTALALAIGAVSSDTTDPVTRLGHALAARGSILIVLDNFEQVVAEAAAAVSRWVQMAPELNLIVTSRERLRIPEERVYELGPLPVPSPEQLDRQRALESSAVRLLLERAPGFSFADAEAPLVARVLSELDGLPLAIELFAARLPLIGLKELSLRMHERLDLLARGSRTADARQATLRGALDWSWELLPEAERHAFAATSAFVSGFDLDAFVAVTGAGLDVLHELRDKSLVVVAPSDDGRSRFSTYASIRAYAEERLSELGAGRAAFRAHAEHYAARGRDHAAHVDTSNGDEAWAWLSSELDNLLAGHERMAKSEDPAEQALGRELLIAAEPVLAKRGPHLVHAELLSRAVRHPSFESADAVTRARLLRAHGGALRNRGELTASAAALAAAEESASEPTLRAEIAAEAGFVEQGQGSLDGARRCYERALALLGNEGDARVRARTLAGLGLLQHSQGRLDEAFEHYDEGMRLARRAGDVHTLAGLEKDVGSLRLQQGRLDEAREHYARALELEQHVATPSFVGLIEGNLGILEQERGDLAAAHAHFERALDNFKSAGARLFEGHLLGYLAGLVLEQRDAPGAAEHYAAAIAILREVGDRRNEGLFWAGLGAAEAARGRLPAAEEAFSAAKTWLEEVGDPGLLMALELHRGRLDLARAAAAAERGDAERSSEHRAAALAIVQRARASEEQRALLQRSDDARFALRLLNAALEESAVVFDALASELRLPSGERVELSTRAPLRKIVAALIEQRVNRPGQPLGHGDLLSAGWPGERMSAEAGQNRLKVALSTLRKLGLRELILHTGEGWQLDPTVAVVIQGEPPRSARG